MSQLIRETKISGADDVNLFVRVDAVVQPKAVVIIVHGLAEHSGRYGYVAAQLNQMGCVVYRFDNRGHGKSDGKRGDVEDFRLFLNDADKIVKAAQKDYPKLPLFMLGHSMGGFITTAYGIEYPDILRGQILSGPAVVLQESLEGLKDMDYEAAAHDKVANSLSEQISRDPQVVNAYNNDPLVLKEFSLRLVGEVFVKGAVWLMEAMTVYHYPCLILHGGEDRIVTPDASRYMHEKIGSNDNTLRIYDDLFHEILNEPEKDQVLDDIKQWIASRL